MWTEPQETQLLTLNAAGLSAAEISRAMGSVYSRRAVIGKLHRLAARTQNRRNRFKTSKKRAQMPDAVPASDGARDLMALGAHDCRYAFEVEPPYSFCAQPTDGGPWCPIHKALVFTKAGTQP